MWVGECEGESVCVCVCVCVCLCVWNRIPEEECIPMKKLSEETMNESMGFTKSKIKKEKGRKMLECIGYLSKCLE